MGGSRCIANHILRDTGNPYFLARTNHPSNNCTSRTHHYFRSHGQSGPHSESDWERGADLFCSAKLSSSARVPLARYDAKRAGTVPLMLKMSLDANIACQHSPSRQRLKNASFTLSSTLLAFEPVALSLKRLVLQLEAAG